METGMEQELPEEYEKQVYSVDSEEEGMIEPRETMPQPKSETALGDTFDLYDMSTKIHSPIGEITRDFTLSDLSSEVINNKLPVFIREQLKIMKVIEQYLVIPLNTLEVMYDTNKARTVYKQLQETSKEIKTLLLNEIYSMVIMSRSVNGKIIKAILMHGKTPELRDEFEGSLNTGIMNKLKEKSN